ncbi:MAG: hypothetical protein A2Z77_07625 [Chloroflexi bacterium RBG_13_51_36]|nr:MAG: hypothetical protein A2Z77_07625 [Chloroflexi bacterium RBG_13_51_36]
MAEDAEEFLRRNREIEEIRDLKERIGVLDDRVSGVQRALVEFKALNISQTISNNLWMKGVGVYLNEGTADNDTAEKYNEITSELRVALASLRGKLAEEAIPEDAYKDWIKDARRRLSKIVGANEADSLIGGSYDWGKIIGLRDIEWEE